MINVTSILVSITSILSIEASTSSLNSGPKVDECLANEYQSPTKHDERHAILRDVILARK
jgi:hypothetical protein